MRGSLILILLRLFSRTPLRVNQTIGIGLGNILWLFVKREKKTSRINMKLCFPEQPSQWQEATARKSFIHLIATMLETPRIWRLNKKQITQLIENPEVLEEALTVYRQGNGLMLAAPHLGNWELIGQLFAAHTTMTSLYRPPRIEKLSDWIKKARQNTGAELVPTDSSGVRALAKSLSQGHCSGVLPDQEPEDGGGIFSPFYSHSAYTMYLLPRLVRKRKIPVVFIFAERVRNGKFKLHAHWQKPEIYDADVNIACESMNQQIETLIAECPSQYNWAYKRFKKQPDNSYLY